jgi:hypothetical protein
LKLSDSYSFNQIKKALEKYNEDKENVEMVSKDIFKEKYFKDEKIIDKESKDYFTNFLKAFKYEFEAIFQVYEKHI